MVKTKFVQYIGGRTIEQTHAGIYQFCYMANNNERMSIMDKVCDRNNCDYHEFSNSKIFYIQAISLDRVIHAINEIAILMKIYNDSLIKIKPETELLTTWRLNEFNQRHDEG